MWDFSSFFALVNELALLQYSFVRGLIKHSSQKKAQAKYRDSIDDDSKLTICPFTVRLLHSVPANIHYRQKYMWLWSIHVTPLNTEKSSYLHT